MKNSFLIILVLVLVSCKSTKEVYVPVAPSDMKFDITEKVKKAEVDKLNNTYILTPDNKIICYNSKKDKKYEYANKMLGKISSFDLRDPLRTILFIDDFDQIVVLDNTLSELSTISLQDFEYTDISNVCKSNDNSLWLYDRANRRLVKIDDKGGFISQSANMEDFGLNNLQPIKMVEAGNKLVIADPDQGFLIFDNYGQFIKKFQVNNIVDFQFDGRLIVFYDGKGVKAYNINFPNSTMMGYPSKLRSSEIKNVYFTSDNWYGIYNNGINIIERADK